MAQTAAQKKLIEDSTEQLKQSISNESTERAKAKDDIRFVTLDQWPEAIRKARENDPNGSRPCLTIDKINQYRMQIVNEIRKNRPAVKVRPVDDVADPKTAQVFQGITRHIEDVSVANVCYETAARSAVDSGVGYYRFVTEYVDPKSFDQEIYIRPIFDRFTVYMGPHVWPDGSDAEYAFIIEDMTEAKFKREFPKAKLPKSADIGGTDAPFYVGEDSVRVAEKLYYTYEQKTLVRLADGAVMFKDEYDAMPEPDGTQGPPSKPAITEQRETMLRKVKWAKMTASEVLDERDWAGRYLPIVKVTGHQEFVDGKKVTWGIVRPAIDSARMYNYWASTITEKLALAPKAPFIAAEGQIEGHEQEWATANTVNYSVLTYKAIEVNGNAVPPPKRQEPAAMESAMAQQLQVIEHDIQTSLGMFKASVGEQQANQSGRAIRALQNQSDTATFHFPDNLANSICYGGKILIDLIPKVYDTKHVRRILGEDGKPQTVRIDPKQQEAARQVRTVDPNTQAIAIKTIYNLNVGRYDVTATVGPSYATRRMETVDVLSDAMKGNPNLVPVLGDLMFRAIDSDISERAADRLQKMLPPQLKDNEDGAQPQISPQVAMQVQAMGQAMKALQEENQQLKAKEQQALAKIASTERIAGEKIAAGERESIRDAELQRILAEQEARWDERIARMEAMLKARAQVAVAEIGADATRDAAHTQGQVAMATAHMQANRLQQGA